MKITIQNLLFGGNIMEKCLLSIDWDYFVCTPNGNMSSCIENQKTILDLWYKRYIRMTEGGKDIRNFFKLSASVDTFWSKISKTFRLKKGIPAYLSDSHALSYKIAELHGCNTVYLFDAHSDLGYGGFSSLDFEVNCANWLGKLLKNGLIREANVIYSPFTAEKPEHFSTMNRVFHIRYPSVEEIKPAIDVDALHICRSGAWTPPWFDEKFYRFAGESGAAFHTIDCPARKWDTTNMTFSDEIYYRMA